MLSACIAVAVVISILLTIIIIWFLRRKQYKYSTIGRVKGGNNDDPCSGIITCDIPGLIEASKYPTNEEANTYVTCCLNALQWKTPPETRFDTLINVLSSTKTLLIEDEAAVPIMARLWGIAMNDNHFIRMCIILDLDGPLSTIDTIADIIVNVQNIANVDRNNMNDEQKLASLCSSFKHHCITYLVYRKFIHIGLFNLRERLINNPEYLKAFWDAVINASMYPEVSYDCINTDIIPKSISMVSTFINKQSHADMLGVNSLIEVCLERDNELFIHTAIGFVELEKKYIVDTLTMCINNSNYSADTFNIVISYAGILATIHDVYKNNIINEHNYLSLTPESQQRMIELKPIIEAVITPAIGGLYRALLPLITNILDKHSYIPNSLKDLVCMLLDTLSYT